eukprot:GEMP01034007.1.p1 GENE.GEMP01034007.1~~GEMP01034007.1.p1  ORF type:complete len:205 (+),score=37.44 GEMP01034007.1:224-838(+)
MLKRTQLKLFWGAMVVTSLIIISVVFFLIQSVNFTPLAQKEKAINHALGIVVLGSVFGVIGSRLVFQIMKPGGSRQFEAPSFSDEEIDDASDFDSQDFSDPDKQSPPGQKIRVKDPEKMALIAEMKTKVLGSDRLWVLESSVSKIKHFTKDEVDEILALFQSATHADTAKTLLQPKIVSDEVAPAAASKKAARKKSRKKQLTNT